MKNPKPEMFKPSLQDQVRVAKELAKQLSPERGVKLSDGSMIRGSGGILKGAKND